MYIKISTTVILYDNCKLFNQDLLFNFITLTEDKYYTAGYSYVKVIRSTYINPASYINLMTVLKTNGQISLVFA